MSALIVLGRESEHAHFVSSEPTSPAERTAGPSTRSAPATRSRREEKSAETRARLLDAARRRFARQGFEQTTTRQIAEDAGVAHGTLFRYAPTKEDLVERLFEDAIGAALDDALATLPHDGSFSDVAIHCYTRFIDVYDLDRPLARVLVKELPFLQGDAGERQYGLTAKLFQALLEDLAVRQAAGTIDAEVPPFTIASASFSLYLGALIALVTSQLDRDGALALLRQSHRLLERGASS